MLNPQTVNSRGAAGTLRRELRPLLTLAGPVIVSELGWMAMGLVDTAMVGRVGAEAIGAVSIGAHAYFVCAMFGMGVLLGLDPLVSQAWGAGRHEEAHRSLAQGIYIAVALGVTLMALLWTGSPHLGVLGITPVVLPQAQAYLDVATWGLIPLLLFAAVRRYLQAMGIVRPVMFVVLAANVVNAIANWVLIFGHAGFPALGAVGSAWATTVARVFMLVAIVALLWRIDRERGGRLAATSWTPAPRLLRSVIQLGVPAAIQLTLEGGVFTAATFLAAGLAPTALAAHQISLAAASFSFMVPLAVSSAGAVRVGQCLGAAEPTWARAAGGAALMVGGTFMGFSALMFVAFPQAIFAVFTDEIAVVAVGVGLLRVAAAFQLFDGLQVVATGILRGAGDTRTSMYTSVVAYWVLGLPLGWWLCFRGGQGVIGLWFGLTSGLVFAAVTLLLAWARVARRFTAPAADGGRRLVQSGGPS